MNNDSCGEVVSHYKSGYKKDFGEVKGNGKRNGYLCFVNEKSIHSFLSNYWLLCEKYGRDVLKTDLNTCKLRLGQEPR